MTLFEDFAQRFARGERPDVREYLDRAGPRSDELARLIDRYLASTPPPAPSAERVEFVRAWLAGDSPLLELRRQRGLRREAVVEALLRGLGLDEGKRAPLRRRYHELESGLLSPAGVSARVWDALTGVFATDVRELASWRPRPPDQPQPAYLRAPTDAIMASAGPPRVSNEDQHDAEVDSLFLSAR